MSNYNRPEAETVLCDEILSELECPVCTYYMKAPIRQCKIGHCICDDCFTQVKNCPVCRGPKSNARCFKLEDLLAEIIFPCRYKKEGCHFIDLGSYIKEHEMTCPYGTFKCAFRTSTNCSWSGPIEAFLKHAKLTHPDAVFISRNNTITCKDFVKEEMGQSGCRSHAIFLRDKEVFKCTIDVQYDTGMMRWCIFYIGVENCPENFTYRIDIENHHNPSQKVSLEASCKHYMQEDIVFQNNACMFTNYRVLKRFCCDGDLKFTVKIIDRVRNCNSRF